MLSKSLGLKFGKKLLNECIFTSMLKGGNRFTMNFQYRMFASKLKINTY